VVRAAALAEVILAAAIVIGHNVYQAIPNEVLVLLPISALSLIIRRQSLSSIGFKRPESWLKTVVVAAATAAALQLLSTFVTEPLISRFTNQPSDLSQFRDVVGNVRVALIWLAIIWTFAAFGEEFVYRGYVLNRIADALGGSTTASWLAVFVGALLFGIGHYYQGPTGMIDTGVTGLIFGSLYVWYGRNLWAPILAHGLTNTIAIALVFFGFIKV
jgi:membrane protease YdiL (CAAX protease family)